MNYKNKILITGATKGIGYAIACRFAQENFDVIICSRDQHNLDFVKEKHPAFDCIVCDMADKEQVEKLANYVREKYGALDVLVNNAGQFVQGQIHLEDDAIFERLMHVNLFGPYYLTKRLLPDMIQRRSGTIFNLCSTASITPYINGGSYCISKFALLGFSKVLREELKAHDIRVVSVLPGATLTDSWRGTELPATRFMPSEDIADAVYSAYQMSPRTVVEEILIRPMLGDIS